MTRIMSAKRFGSIRIKTGPDGRARIERVKVYSSVSARIADRKRKVWKVANAR